MCFAAKLTKQLVKARAPAPRLPSLAVCLERREGGEKELNKPSCKVLNPTACQCGETLEALQKDVGLSVLSIHKLTTVLIGLSRSFSNYSRIMLHDG